MPMFVVYRYNATEEGTFSSNIGVTDDEAVALVVTEDWKARAARSQAVYREARAWQEAWEVKNPRPVPANTPRLKLPYEGIPKRNMTEAQLREREKAKVAHQQKVDADLNPFRTWYERKYSEFAAWFEATFTEQEREDTDTGVSYIQDEFSYEPIEVLHV